MPHSRDASLQLSTLLRHVAIAATLVFAADASAQMPPQHTDDAEARTAQAFETARQQGPLALHAFLASMPKGADLHNHLGGDIYAESWISQAAADGLCVDTARLSLLDKHEPARRTVAPVGAPLPMR